MKTRFEIPVTAFGIFFILALILFYMPGCAGNGQGLDENGNPIGSDGGGPPLPVDFPPTFTNIQNNVFTPICVNCHIGSSAPEGMQLDAAHAYDMLVGIAATERPDLARVQPGNPDVSYLIRKLQGGPEIVGAQMPFNLPPLRQETINSIRVWISMGAPRN